MNTICKKCKHDMKRSRCRSINGFWPSVRCNKCKTVYKITLKEKKGKK